MNLKKLIGISAGVLVGVTLLACGGGNPSDGTSGKGTQAEAPSAPADKKDGPVVAALGGKGLVFSAEKIEVAISKPGTYKRGEYAEPVPKGQVAFSLNITVLNASDQAIKPSGLYFTASVGAESAEAEQIFDTEAGYNGTPDTALLPGKKATFKLAFRAPTAEANPEINVNVTTINTSTTGLFQGHLKG